MRYFRMPRNIVLQIACILLTVSCLSWSQQFLLLNTYVKDTRDSFLNHEQNPDAIGPNIPKDWTSPVDYRQGRWIQRFVIHSMGNGEYPHPKASYIITIRDDPGFNDAHPWDAWCEFKTSEIGYGVNELDCKVDDIWKKDGFSWATNPTARLRTQLRVYVTGNESKRVDVSHKKIGDSWMRVDGVSSAQDVIDWFLPLTFDYQAVIVAPGTTFEGWDKYPLKSGFEPKNVDIRKEHFRNCAPRYSSLRIGENIQSKVFDMRGRILAQTTIGDKAAGFELNVISGGAAQQPVINQ